MKQPVAICDWLFIFEENLIVQLNLDLDKRITIFAKQNKNDMPTLSMFFGIIIRMYYAPKEHNPPHIHVYYQE